MVANQRLLRVAQFGLRLGERGAIAPMVSLDRGMADLLGEKIKTDRARF
jgi:hypothetical protein